MNKGIATSYSLPPDIILWVKDYAKKFGKRHSHIVEMALIRYRKKIEAREDELIG